MISLFRTLKLVRHFFAYVAISALLFEQLVITQAFAQTLPITPDGSTNTLINHAPNDVPVVNIAAPNSGGLSHNRFTDYNVNQDGLILNNASGSQNGVVSTEIGGLITDNPNLVSGSASIILNEVTSNNISQINGYTEIAGRRADLILSNPNGVSFAGAGFINVSKLTTVIGSVDQFNPNPNSLTFSLSGNAYEITNGFLPKLTISGTGIDLESVSSTDLVANLMNIVSPIYGADNEVNLRAGDKSFNYLSKEVTSNSDGAPSQLAIDASALGKIQAGKIFIIATKDGFGVKYSADMLASRNGINIDALGNISYNNAVTTAGNIEITSRNGNIENVGILQNQGSNDIILNAANNIFNSGNILSNRNLTLTTSNLENSNQIISANNLTISAATITNSNLLFAVNKIDITANNNLTNNNNILSYGDIEISAGTLNNNNQIAASNDVTINADIFNNSSAVLGLRDVNLNVNNFDNSNSSVQSGRNLNITSTNINNLNGLLFANSAINLNLGNSNYTITGSLESTGHINIAANNITNHGSVIANDYILINAANNFTNGFAIGDNSNVQLVAGNLLDITAANSIENYATLSSQLDLTLTSSNSNINNNAKIIGGIGTTTISALNGAINQNNSLSANGDLILNAIDLNNLGSIETANNLTTNLNNLSNGVGALIYAGLDMELM